MQIKQNGVQEKRSLERSALRVFRCRGFIPSLIIQGVDAVLVHNTCLTFEEQLSLPSLTSTAKNPVIHFEFITVCRLSFSKRFFLMTLLELLCKLLVIVLAFCGKNFVYPNLFPTCLSHSCSPLSVLDCVLQFLCLTRSCRNHSGICLQLCLPFLHYRLVGDLRQTGCKGHHSRRAPVASSYCHHF